MTKLKKCVIGIILCLICLLCSAILIFSVADSLQQKSRLEMIGATVEMKLSFWFFADVLVLVVSGILVTKLVCKNISFIRSKEKVSVDIEKKMAKDFVLQDIDYGYDDYTEENDTVLDSTDISEKAEKKSGDVSKTEENKTLRINYGSSKKAAVIRNKDEYNSKAEKKDSSEESCFFSAGGDL